MILGTRGSAPRITVAAELIARTAGPFFDSPPSPVRTPTALPSTEGVALVALVFLTQMEIDMPNYDEMPEKCMNCYFFEWLDNEEGSCHRYPPQHIFKGRDGNDADDWRLPVVYGEVGWCGEFKFDPSRVNDRGDK